MLLGGRNPVVFGIAHGVEGDVMLVHKFHFHVVEALARDGIEHAAIDDLPHGVEAGKGREEAARAGRRLKKNFLIVMDDFRFVNHGFRHVLLFILRRSACFVTLQNHFF